MSRTRSFVVGLILIVGLYLVISTVVSVGAQEPEPIISQNAPIYWAGWMLVGICALAGLFVLAIFIPRRK